MADNYVYILNNMFSLKKMYFLILCNTSFIEKYFICKMRFYFIPVFS